MKKLITILLLLICVAASAQNISVTSFRLSEMDQTANQQGTMVKDQNGQVCALIKIETTQTGFSFDVGSLGVTKSVQKPGEIWLYVPSGVRKLTISHPQLGVLRDYAFPIAIEKARTYVMVLESAIVETTIKKAVTAQYVLFNLNPKNAAG